MWVSVPGSERSALGSDVVGVVVLLSDHLLGQFVHLIQLVHLSLQVLLKLSLLPLQSLNLCHRALHQHKRRRCLHKVHFSTSVEQTGGSYPQVLIGQEGLLVAEPALKLLYRGQEDLQDREAVSTMSHINPTQLQVQWCKVYLYEHKTGILNESTSTSKLNLIVLHKYAYFKVWSRLRRC